MSSMASTFTRLYDVQPSFTFIDSNKPRETRGREGLPELRPVMQDNQITNV